MSFELPRSKIRMPLEDTAVAVCVGILARDLEAKESCKIECISWNREGAEDPNTVMEERLGRNIIHKSRSMAACPGLEQPEGLGRGTLGGWSRILSTVQQFNGMYRAGHRLFGYYLIVCLRCISLQVRIILPCHQYECLFARTEKGAVQSEWRASRWVIDLLQKN